MPQTKTLGMLSMVKGFTAIIVVGFCNILYNITFAQVVSPSTLHDNCLGTGGLSPSLVSFLNARFSSLWTNQKQCIGDVGITVQSSGDLLSGNMMQYDVTVTNNGSRWTYGGAVNFTSTNGLTVSGSSSRSYGQMGPGVSQMITFFVIKSASTSTGIVISTGTFTLVDSSITDTNSTNNTNIQRPIVRGSTRAICYNPALTIPSYECDVLMDFYTSTNGSGWTNRTNWGTSPDVDSWFGVNLVSSGSRQYVGQICLSNASESIACNMPWTTGGSVGNNLSGTLNTSFGGLTELRRVFLNNNKLAGTIPDVFTGMGKLTDMMMGWNKFTGPIPSSLGLLPIIDSINLESNQLAGTIPTTFINATTLRFLWLNNNKLTGPLPDLSAANWLQFQIGQNQFTGELPEWLGYESNLDMLRLDNNQFVGSIPASWVKMTGIGRLHLQANQLTGNLEVFSYLNGNQVYQFHIANNNFDRDANGDAIVPSNLKNRLSSMEIVNISGQGDITPPQIDSIDLPILPSFNHLGLNMRVDSIVGPSGSMVKAAYMMDSPYHIGYVWSPVERGYNGAVTGNALSSTPVLMTSGFTYKLGFWARTESGTREIKPCLTEYVNDYYTCQTYTIGTTWTYVSVTKTYVTSGYNSGGLAPRAFITMTGGSNFYYHKPTISQINTVPQTIDGSFNFDLLTYENSSTTGAGFASGLTISFTGSSLCQQALFTPDKIIKGSASTRIRITAFEPVTYAGCQIVITDRAGLVSNRITLPTFTSNEYGICNEVSDITTSDCKALVDLYQLTNGSGWTLKTNWKGIGDSTPDTACDWYGVQCANGRVSALYLGGNTAPTNECQYDNPMWGTGVTFNGNNLSGVLPQSLNNLTGLTVLCAPKNSITGSLPSLVGLKNLQVISFFNNKLNGVLSNQLDGIVSLRKIFLQSNLLIGNPPSSWGNLRNLTNISLDTNALTGTLPSSWGNLTGMSILWLNNNQLTGPLPASWSSMTGLYQLQLSNNQLTGPLPASWSSLNPEYIRLDGNNLQGFIPEWIATSWTNTSNGRNSLANNCFSASDSYMSTSLKNFLTSKGGLGTSYSYTGQKNCAGSIGSRLWVDGDNDGMYDNGETGTGGVTVALRACVDQIPTNTGKVLNHELYSYYSFDEGDARDDQGVNPLTPYNARFTQGIMGQGLLMTGGLNHLLTNDVSDFPQQQITAAFWTKTKRIGNAFISYANQISTNAFLIINDQTSGGLNICITGPCVAALNAKVHDDQWHHIAVTWNNVSGDVRVYKDGVLVDSITFAKGATLGSMGSLAIGGEQDAIGGGWDANQSLSGLMDDVRIYSRALSASEVSQLYATSNPMIASNMPISYSGALIRTTTTASNGSYSFTNVPAGKYYLEYTNIPAGYKFTTQNIGGYHNSANSDVNPWSAKSSCFELYNGTNEVDIDAGLKYLPYASCDAVSATPSPVLAGQPVTLSVAGYGVNAQMFAMRVGNNVEVNQTISNQGTNWGQKIWSMTFNPKAARIYQISGAVDGTTERLDYYESVAGSTAYKVIGDSQWCAVQGNMGPVASSLGTINQIATIPSPVIYCTTAQVNDSALPYASSTNQPPKMLVRNPNSCVVSLTSTSDPNVLCDYVTDMSVGECKALVSLYNATEGWVDCANENSFCSFTGTRVVRYGSGAVYNTGTFSEGVNCTNGIFGDPLFGDSKRCSYLADGGTWTNSTNWKFMGDSTPRTACDWYGVSCVGGRVVGLNLSSNNLTGTIASVGWWSLPYLQTLELYGNRLGGQLPDSVKYLTSLQTLRLGFNNFVGTLPATWSGMNAISELHLANAGGFNGSIPAAWSGIADTVVTLNLSGILVQTGQTLPSWLGSATKLQELQLQSNNFLQELTGQFDTLTGLRVLQLQGNQLYGDLSKITLPKLTNLYTNSYGGMKSAISQNCLYTGRVAGATGTFLDARFLFGSNPVTDWKQQIPCNGDLQITSYAVVGNLMTGFTIDYVVSYKNNGPLPSYNPIITVQLASGLNITISGSYLGGRTTGIRLPDINPGQTGELRISVNKSQIGTGVWTNLINTFKIDDSLIAETVTSNNIVTSAVDARGSNYTICVHPQMTISQDECEALGDLYTSTNGSGWTNKTNWLGSPDVESWFGVTLTAISGSNSVSKICLSDPTEARSCNDGRQGASGNNLSGTIPTTISYLTKLTSLQLSQNSKLIGAIPYQIAGLSLVEDMRLMGTSISDMGTGIANMPRLKKFYLTDSPSLIVASNLGQSPVLEELILMRNNLTSLPDLSGLGDTLTFLQLHNNRLPQIPTWLANGFVKLRQIDLSYNGMRGQIGTVFDNMPNLDFLYVGNNYLEGSLPQLTNSKKLGTIYLHYNKLSGTLPSSWSTLTGVAVIRVDGNKGVIGTLPSSWSNLRLLNTVNIGNTLIGGQIPSSWSVLTGMREFIATGSVLDGPITSFFQNWTQLKTNPVTSSLVNNCMYTGTVSGGLLTWMNTYTTWNSQKICESDLQLSIVSKSAGGFDPGKVVTYLISYANNSIHWSYEPKITINLYPGLVLSGTEGTTGIIALPMLSPGQTGQIAITVLKRGTGSGTALYTNNFSISDNTTEDKPSLGDDVTTYYSFDNTSEDGRGIANLNGSTSYTSGFYQNAIRFNGISGQTLTSTLSGAELSGKSFTISAYVNPTSLQINGSTYLMIGGEVVSNKALHLRLMRNGSIRFGLWNDDLDSPLNSFQTGVWTNIAVTYDAVSKQRAIYVNGAVVKTGISLTGYVGLNGIRIGSMFNNDDLYVGAIDDVRIYNRALTDAEVSNIYTTSSNHAISDAGSVRWFKYNECIGISDIPQDECESLMDIYNSLKGRSWNNKTNWATVGDTTPATACDWFGVQCSAIPEDSAPSTTSGLNQGLVYRYRDYNATLPIFFGFGTSVVEPLIPTRIGTTTNVQNQNYLDIIGSDGDTHVVTWEGYINIPKTEAYTFYTLSDDNSRVFVDNKLVVQDLGCCTEKVGASYILTAGLHSFRVEMQEGGGSNYMNLRWSSPSIAKQFIPDNVFYYDPSYQPQKHVVGLWLNGNGKSFLDSWSPNSNNLSGAIPSSISDLQYLKGIDLQAANLSGTTIPSSIGQLSNLSVMRCEGCSLTGTLPSTMGLIQNLRVLYLGNNQLQGPIPSSWSGLIYLDTLGLFNNKLTGPLPTWLTNRQRINILNLANNQFTGTLPDSWASVPSLRTIYLGYNQLGGTLPDQWKNMYAVQNIGLQANQFTGTLPESWTGIRALVSLDISNNTQLTGVLPSSWGGIGTLKQIRLGGSNLRGTLPSSWSNLTGLERIHLDGNNFEGEIPPSWYTGMRSLKIITTESNSLGGPVSATGIQLWTGLTATSSRIGLNCMYTGSLTPAQSTWIDTYFVSNWRTQRRCGTDMEMVSVVSTGNLVTGAFMTYTVNYANNGSNWAYNPTVSVVLHSGLELMSGGRTGSVSLGLIAPQTSGTITITIKKVGIGSGTETYTNLFTLYDNTLFEDQTVGNNGAVATGTVKWFKYPICGMIQDVAQVECEALGDFYTQFNGANWNNKTNWMGSGDTTPTTVCDWYGVACGDAPVSLGSSPKVVTMLCMSHATNTGAVCNQGGWYPGGVSSNNLSGTLPASVTDLRYLKHLSVTNNPNVRGTLPENIGDLKDLKVLGFNYGPKLTGSLPASMSGLTSLQVLALIDNKTFGVLPSGLLDLPELAIVWLDGNQLTGTLPATSQSPLNDFYIPGNPSLGGDLPSWISNKSSLTWIRIGGTALSGTMPTFTGTPNLFHLDMTSMPNIRGSLPSELSALGSKVGTLRLSNLNLTGTLPSSWSNLSNIQEISISNNNLTGTLPSSWSNLSKLTTLSLASNNLQGEIPSSWSNLTGLNSFNIANNMIDGLIPTWINTSYSLLSNGSSALMNNCMYTGQVSGALRTFMDAKFGAQWQTQKLCQTDPMIQSLVVTGSLQDANSMSYIVTYRNNGSRWSYDPKITLQLWSGLGNVNVTGNITTALGPIAPGKTGSLSYIINKKWLLSSGLTGFMNKVTVSDITVMDDPAMHLLMDGTTTDIITNRTATATNITPSVDRRGFANSAFDFNGSSSMIRIAHYQGFDTPTNAVTLAAWIRPTSFGDWRGIITKGMSNSPYALHLNASGSIRFTINQELPGATRRDSTLPLTLNQWNHVVAVYDGSVLRFYVNGVLDPTSHVLNITMTPNTEDVVIGADLPGGDEYFAGSIDDPVIYTRALSSSEVVDLYQGQQSDNVMIHTGMARGSIYPVCLQPDLTVPQSECEALMDIYTANNGSNWNNRLNWGTSPDIDSWFGVTVQGGRVTRLNLSNATNDAAACALVSSGNNVTNMLSPSVNNLTYLTDLCLGNNSLTGSLSLSYTGLSRLVTLSVHHNTINQLSQPLSGYVALQTVDISSNNLTGSVTGVVGSSLSAMKNLWLNNNNLTQGLSIISSRPTLQSVRLSYNKLSGTLPSTMGSIVLGELMIDNNNLDRDELNRAMIPSGLRTWYNGIVLKNSDNQGDITNPIITATSSIPTSVTSIGFPLSLSINENSYASGMYTSGAFSGQYLSGLFVTVTGSTLCSTISSDPITSHTGSVTIMLYPESDGNYTSCQLTIRDRANNVSNTVSLGNFTYTQPPYRLHVRFSGSGVVVTGGQLQQVKDLSPFEHQITMYGGVPVYSLSALNYNPGVQFAVNKSLALPGIFRKQAFDNVTILMVAHPGTSNASLLFEQSTSGYPVVLGTNTWKVGSDSVGFSMSQTAQSLITATHSKGGTHKVRIDGVDKASIATNTSLQVSGVSITSLGSGLTQGFLGEAIVYTKSLDATSLNYLESYLALKYGITLPANYTSLNAAGQLTTIWSQNTQYQSQVIGLGRYMTGPLPFNQTTSTAAQSGSIALHSRGTWTDGQYVMVGSNSGDHLSWSRTLPILSGYKALGRTRYVQKQGGTHQFDVSIAKNSIAEFDFPPVVLVSNSADFSTIVASGTLVQSGERWITPSTLMIDNGQYITFAIGQSSLGGRVWLDLNRDGVQSPSEPSVSGVKVQLRQCPSSNQTSTGSWYLLNNQSSPRGVLYETITSTGTLNYNFKQLNPGSYYMTYDWSQAVIEPQDNGTLLATKHALNNPGYYNGGSTWSDYESYYGRSLDSSSLWYGSMSLLSGMTMGLVDSDMMSADYPSSSSFKQQASPCYTLVAGTTQQSVGAGLMVNNNADLGITSSLSTSTMTNISGSRATFDVVISNSSQVRSRNTQVIVQLPDEVAVEQVTNISNNNQLVSRIGSGNRVKVYIGSFTGGASMTYRFNLIYNGQGDDGDQLAINAKIESTTIDPTTSNNQASTKTITLTRNGSTVGDLVWIDVNGNGIQDNGEGGSGPLAGIMVGLYNASNGSLVKTIKTISENGSYQFTSVQSGTYYIEVTNVPKGYAFTDRNTTTATTANDSNIANINKTASFTVNGLNDDMTIDIGLKPLSPLAQCSAVANHKLRIGQSYPTFSDSYIAGAIYGVRMFDVRRTWTETADYNNSTSLPVARVYNGGMWGSWILGYIAPTTTKQTMTSDTTTYSVLKKPLSRTGSQMLLSYQYVGCYVNPSVPGACVQGFRYNSCHAYEITSCGDGVVDAYNSNDYLGGDWGSEECDFGINNGTTYSSGGVQCTLECTVLRNRVADLGISKKDNELNICNLPAGSDGALSGTMAITGMIAPVVSGASIIDLPISQ